jgi:hypothetical protein
MGRPGFNYSPYAYNDCYSMNNGSCYRNSNYCGWNNYSNRCESRYYY